MSDSPSHVLVVGAGAAGLMAAHKLAQASKRVTVLEARRRLGGRIWSLPEAKFGYPAAGGAEFVHGAAPLTSALMRTAGLRLEPRGGGSRWNAVAGAFSRDDTPLPHTGRFYDALLALDADLPVARFLETQFAEPRFAELRRRITRMVEGYDAADPERFSTFALREEWTSRGGGGGRVAGGFGALIDHLAAACGRHGAVIRCGAVVTAIAEENGRIVARCEDGTNVEGDAAILAVPLPLLAEIVLPPAARAKAATAVAGIGYGNVVKILLGFATRWWAAHDGRDLADLSFVFSREAAVPTWWTQYPAPYPVLTGWFAGPKADRVASLSAAELVEMGLASLARMFRLSRDELRRKLVAARAINWGNDRFARGAYSYATPQTPAALRTLKKPDGGALFFSGEALYEGPDIGTVEAALATGHETAQALLDAGSG
jgi:monoamine oxidase